MPSPTQEWGAAHERIAEKLLHQNGFQIIERNWRGGGGEVDRIAWDDELLCFVEVRARRSDRCGSPLETVDRRKQRKIVRAALAYVSRFDPGSMPMVRFDVVSILDGPDQQIELVKNAFDAGR